MFYPNANKEARKHVVKEVADNPMIYPSEEVTRTVRDQAAVASATRTEPHVERTQDGPLAAMNDVRPGASWSELRTSSSVLITVKIYADVVAVKSLSLSVGRHEISRCWAVIAASRPSAHAGRFREATSGRIFLDNEEITALPPYKRPVNMMFQPYALFPHMTVEANVAFGLTGRRAAQRDSQPRVRGPIWCRWAPRAAQAGAAFRWPLSARCACTQPGQAPCCCCLTNPCRRLTSRFVRRPDRAGEDPRQGRVIARSRTIRKRR